jgi:hypothetical protein
VTPARTSQSSSGTGGACFDFEIHSALSFRYLRKGGHDLLTVVAPSDETPDPDDRLLIEWVARPGRPFSGRLHRGGLRFRLWVGDTGWYVIDPVQRWIAIPETSTPARREERLWSVPAGLCMLDRGDLPVHAAAVDVEGSAVLFAAPGRFGKTTLAAGFHREGYRVLSEDMSCLRVAGAPAVLPGPAMLRVRTDVLEGLRLPDVTEVARSDDRASLAIVPERRGDCRAVPIRAVVLLRPVSTGVTVERTQPAEALRDLWALTLKTPDAASRARCFTQLADLLARVPAWNVYRPLDLGALGATIDAIISSCLARSEN